MRELDLCLSGLLVITQSPEGLATTDAGIDKQCNYLKEADTCLKDYTKRCMTQMQREVFSFAANSSLDLMSQYCTKGSDLRANYLKHAKCLNEVHKKDLKVCLKDLPSGCCLYTKFTSCFFGSLERRCGKEANAFVVSTMRKATSRLPEIVCRDTTCTKSSVNTPVISKLLNQLTKIL